MSSVRRSGGSSGTSSSIVCRAFGLRNLRCCSVLRRTRPGTTGASCATSTARSSTRTPAKRTPPTASPCFPPSPRTTECRRSTGSRRCASCSASPPSRIAILPNAGRTFRRTPIPAVRPAPGRPSSPALRSCWAGGPSNAGRSVWLSCGLAVVFPTARTLPALTPRLRVFTDQHSRGTDIGDYVRFVLLLAARDDNRTLDAVETFTDAYWRGTARGAPTRARALHLLGQMLTKVGTVLARSRAGDDTTAGAGNT